MRDTGAGVKVSLTDQTTGASGSMTASTANGFAQVLYRPDASHCSEQPYAFHPQFSTSTPHTRAEWTAHTVNVAYSDEIGHFEYCNKVRGNGNCSGGNATDPAHDRDDNTCFPASDSLLVAINGCLGIDTDFDGSSYQPVWPGSGSDPARTSEPIRFSSPTTSGLQYSQVAFESNMVNLERAFGYCTNATLEDCSMPPKGAAFYPMYTTGKSAVGSCEWREGGPAIPGAQKKFGGSPTAEYGSIVPTVYPSSPISSQIFWENFRQVLPNNPCPQ
jgi:hypothetical protein